MSRVFANELFMKTTGMREGIDAQRYAGQSSPGVAGSGFGYAINNRVSVTAASRSEVLVKLTSMDQC